MDKNEIFKIINDWQMDVGEDFLDYFESNVRETNFMFWCLGRGHISQERFNAWVKEYGNAGTLGHSLSELLYNCYDDDNGFSVVHSDDWNQEDQDKAYMILSEFISEIKVYQRRLLEFLEDY